MYYLLGYRILAQPDTLLEQDPSQGDELDNEFKKIKLTDGQIRKRRKKTPHFTRSAIFDYLSDETHTQVRVIIIEPRHEKACLRGFRPGKTQTGLLSYYRD